MNLHEKIALMIIVIAIVAVATVGAFAGNRALPEANEPGAADRAEPVNAQDGAPQLAQPDAAQDTVPQNLPQISDFAGFSDGSSQMLEYPPFADTVEDDETFDFFPALPGFMNSAYDSDPEASTDEIPGGEGSTASAESTESEPEVTTGETTEVTTQVTTPKPETEAPKPETEAPKPETEAPKPETEAPKPKTQAPKAETEAPKAETEAPSPAIPEGMSLREAMVAVALSQVGVTEKAYNNVKYNTWFYGYAVSESNPSATRYAWCAVFLSWCADQAGVSREVFPKTAGVLPLRDFFMSQDRYYSGASYTPKAGDIVFFKTSHVGIVVSVENGVVTLVEGNYSDKVSLTTYPIGSAKLTGFGSPKY